MKLLMIFLFLLLSVACQVDNSIQHNEKENSQPKNLLNKKDISESKELSTNSSTNEKSFSDYFEELRSLYEENFFVFYLAEENKTNPKDKIQKILDAAEVDKIRYEKEMEQTNLENQKILEQLKLQGDNTSSQKIFIYKGFPSLTIRPSTTTQDIALTDKYLQNTLDNQISSSNKTSQKTTVQKMKSQQDREEYENLKKSSDNIMNQEDASLSKNTVDSFYCKFLLADDDLSVTKNTVKKINFNSLKEPFFCESCQLEPYFKLSDTAKYNCNVFTSYKKISENSPVKIKITNCPLSESSKQYESIDTESPFTEINLIQYLAEYNSYKRVIYYFNDFINKQTINLYINLNEIKNRDFINTFIIKNKENQFLLSDLPKEIKDNSYEVLYEATLKTKSCDFMLNVPIYGLIVPYQFLNKLKESENFNISEFMNIENKFLFYVTTLTSPETKFESLNTNDTEADSINLKKQKKIGGKIYANPIYQKKGGYFVELANKKMRYVRLSENSIESASHSSFLEPIENGSVESLDFKKQTAVISFQKEKFFIKINPKYTIKNIHDNMKKSKKNSFYPTYLNCDKKDKIVPGILLYSPRALNKIKNIFSCLTKKLD